jgi:hypothetical protein
VVEVRVVDLVPAGGAEELGAVHVDGDLVARGGGGGGGGVGRGVGGAEDGRAGEAGVEAGWGRGGGRAGRAAGHLARVAADLGPAERAHAEAAAEEAERARG